MEVQVLDGDGNGSLYLRDLEFKRRDLFFVGVADMTVSKNSVSAAEKLLQGHKRRSQSIRLWMAGWHST